MQLCSKDVGAIPEFDWDNLGFGIIPTDYMYVMKCSQGDNFSNGELKRFGNIELSPSAGVLNYGQVRSFNYFKRAAYLFSLLLKFVSCSIYEVA